MFDPLSQYTPDPGEVVIHDPATLKQLLRERGRSEPFHVLYQPRTGTVIDNWRRVGVLSYATGNLLLCVDEMGMLTEYGNFMQDAKGKEPILKAIVHYGRHRKIDIICTAQRPTDVARRYTALCTELRVFQTSENKDLTYLAERMGQSAVSKLAALPKFTFLHWTDAGVAIYSPKLR